jgi:hypothetical protein
MSWLRIKTETGETAFRPGAVLAGVADWKLDHPARHGATIELRLLWYTSGRGTPDVSLVETVQFENPGQEEQRTFRFQLPEGPYSFAGSLVTLDWALEAVLAGASLGRLELTLSPTGEPVRPGG